MGSYMPYSKDSFSPNNIVHSKPEPTTFMQAINEIVELHEKKQNDYGRTDIGDPFSNVRASEDFGIPGWLGAVIRANDKVRRIQKFARSEKLVNESVEDSLMDAAVYFIIALCLFRESNQVAKHSNKDLDNELTNYFRGV